MVDIKLLDKINNCNALQQFKVNYDFINSRNKKMVGITLAPDKNYFVLKYYLELKSHQLDSITNFKEHKMLKNKIAFHIPTSLATGIKINSDFKHMDYLHLKFDQNIKLNIKSQKIKFLDKNLLKYGVSIEKNEQIKHIKKYFYIFAEKEKVKNLFNLNLNTNTVDHFELYETKGNLKVNIVFDFYNNSCVNAFLVDNNLEYYKKDVDAINSFFDKLPVYAGMDKNKNLSLYYSLTEAI